MVGGGSSYQPPDATRTAGKRQTWTEYAGSFTVEWVTACIISMLLGTALLGCGVLLAYPIRVLSGSVVSAVDTLSVPQRGNIPTNGTGTPRAGAAEAMLLQPVWDFAAKDCSHVTTSPAFPGMLSIVYFFLSCLPYTLIDMLPASVPVVGSLKQFKVQQDKPVEWVHIAKTIRTTLYMTFGLQIPGLIHQLVTQGPWPYYVGPHICMTRCSHMTLPDKAPSMAEVVLHLFLCLWLMDILYYWYHKHHHQRSWRYGLLLYKHIHGVHHEWRAPFAWCTQYLHPIELSFTGLASILAPIIVKAHPLTMWVWLCVSIQLSVDAHAGYDFPVSLASSLPSFLGPLKLGGAKHHDDHHKYFRYNYQPFFTYLDDWMGTTYDKNREKPRALRAPRTTAHLEPKKMK